MTRLPRSTYALFVALLPATAVIIGVIVLSQIPKPIEFAAVALVIAGVAVHRDPPTHIPHRAKHDGRNVVLTPSRSGAAPPDCPADVCESRDRPESTGA